MDENIQNQNTQNAGPVIISPPQQEKKKNYNSIILGLGLVILLALTVIIVLNYFNIFSFSKIFTDSSKLLPNKTVNSTSEISPSPTPKKDSGEKSMLPQVSIQPDRRDIPFISCPVFPEVCKLGEEVTQEADGEKIYGLKFNLPKDAKIFASIAGQKTSENSTTFSIDNPQRGMKVKYVVASDSAPSLATTSEVKEKDELGSFTGEKNTLTIFVTATIVKEPVRIGIGPDGQYLTSQN